MKYLFNSVLKTICMVILTELILLLNNGLKQGNVLFNNISTHFIYSYMVLDI